MSNEEKQSFTHYYSFAYSIACCMLSRFCSVFHLVIFFKICKTYIGLVPASTYMDGEGVSGATPLAEELLAADGCKGRDCHFFFGDVANGKRLSWPMEWSHIYIHTFITNWAQEVIHNGNN